MDFNKTFHKVQDSKIIGIVKSMNIDDKVIETIANMYWHQKEN